MSIENINIGELMTLKKLFSSESENNKVSVGINCFIGKKVIVRSYVSGVHFGELIEKNGREVLLKNSRRLWRWTTSNRGVSLSEIANHGVKSGSKLTEYLPIFWCEADELIPCSEESIESIEAKDEYKA